jgi:hypothetical protein
MPLVLSHRLADPQARVTAPAGRFGWGRARFPVVIVAGRRATLRSKITAGRLGPERAEALREGGGVQDDVDGCGDSDLLPKETLVEFR